MELETSSDTIIFYCDSRLVMDHQGRSVPISMTGDRI